jgi:hypothetical protein
MSQPPKPVLPSAQTLELNALQQRLLEFQIQHGELDALIDQAPAINDIDELSLRRMKKKRLALRDQIALLQLQSTPKEPA